MSGNDAERLLEEELARLEERRRQIQEHLAQKRAREDRELQRYLEEEGW